MSSGITIPNSQRTKDKDETKAFTFDWSKELAVGDSIASVAWTLPAGITQAQVTNTPTTATIWISSGTVGTKYIVKCRITTTLSLAHPEEQGFELTVIDEAAQSPDHYCSLDDVNKLVPQAPFTDTSKPNAAVVIDFIEKIAKRMDATLGIVGYVTPVIAPIASEIFRDYCARGAVGLAQQVRDTAVKTAVTESGRPVKNIWTQEYEEFLAQLTRVTFPLELADAPRTNEQLQKQPEAALRSFVESVPLDDEDFDPDNPTIQRNQVL